MGSNRQGLRKISADLIDKASDETAAQVVRLMLAFVGTAAFCLLSLASPDSGLLTSNEKLNVPGAGPVSFFGFILLGPAILIVLRIYLQIYVEHGDRLNRVAQRMPVARAPTLVPLKNPLIRGFSDFTLYLLLPVTMLLFAWKAAVLQPPADETATAFSMAYLAYIWGLGLLCIAAGVIASHAMLPLHRVSWRTRALLSVGAAILTGAVIFVVGAPRRSFELYRANLAGVWLPPGYDLSEADLFGANLSDADLSGADLTLANLRKANLKAANLSGAFLRAAKLGGAKLGGANLSSTDLGDAKLGGADLHDANLRGANLSGADLSDANLRGANLNAILLAANLSGANLSGANLEGAELDGQQQLDGACASDAKLPPGLTLKPCPPTLTK
jgi:uncharacterized protein YjbI with pentapeptide repeats